MNGKGWRWRIAAQAAALACVVLSAGAQAEDVFTGRPLREGFGLAVKFNQGQPSDQLQALDALNVHWVRDTVWWPAMEPRAGVYLPFPEAFQQRLSHYRRHNIGVVFYLAYANPAAYPATKANPLAPIDPEAFGRYAAHIARLLKASGVRHVIEVWNEPHNFVIRKMVGGNWNGKPPSPWVAHYVDMVHHAVTAIKRVEPQTRVITSEDVWVNHYWFLEAGLPAGLDGFGVHPYTGRDAPGPESASVYPGSDWTKPFQVVDADRSFASAIHRLRDHGRAKLGRQPEIWLTEWGWRVGEDVPEGRLTEAMQAVFLPRAFILAEAAGAQALMWFSFHDSTDGAYGLISKRDERRLSFRAFQTLSTELGDFALAARLSDPSQRTAGLQAFLFNKAGVRKVAMWSADNQTRLVTPPATWSVRRVVDAFGDAVTPSDAGTRPTYLVGAVPVYLELEGAGPVRLTSEATR